MGINISKMNLTKKVKKSSTVKELFFTFIATTISIILTFGTARYFEYREKRESGRQTAINVILDIEENIQELDELASIEEEQFNLAQYVLGHIDEIDSISTDTLKEVYQYLSQNQELKFDDSREKIFHSSQESWKHINNAKFINLVQTFFYERHQFQDYYNSEILFHKPISSEERYENLLQNNYEITEQLPKLLPKLLTEPRIECFITYSASRQNYFRETSNNWRLISNECKFLMGITDEELEEYVEKSEHTGRLVKKKDLIGTWTADMNDENEELTFFNDGTFKHEVEHKTRSYAFSGAGLYKGSMEGTWAIKGDTLVRIYPRNKYHYELDFSHISYNDDQKELVEGYIKQYQEAIQARNEAYKVSTDTMTRKNAAYINATGQMVELVRNEIDEEGNEQKRKSYMLRINEKK